MDNDRFDAVARLVAARGTRRAALGVLLTGLLGHDGVALAKPGKRKDTRKKQRKKKRRGGNDGGQPEPPAVCCGSESCPAPARGSTRSGCNFSGQSFAGQNLNGSTLRGIDGRNTNFTATNNRGSVFAEACLQGASFRRAQLGGSTWGGACLFGADFTGADLGGDSAVFGGARFCRTRMPDGSISDRDCGRPTPCCPAQPSPACQTAGDCPDEPCQTASCEDGLCVYAPVNDGDSPNSLCTTHCCDGVCCNPGATECNPLGLCCAPNCDGRACGPDGCGGSCGVCPDDTVCDDIGGICLCTRQSCQDGCCSNGPGNPGLCRPGTASGACGSGGGQCAQCTNFQQCENGECVASTCTGQCTQDNDCPDLRNCVCNRAQGICCARNCTGKVCGSDGCGGSCENLCPPNTVCNSDGTQCLCTAASCPNGCCSNGLGNPGTCEAGDTNQACGLPGGTCRTCTGREQCVNEQCVCFPLTCDDLESVCGTAADGCGGTLECGTCPDPEFPSCFVGVCVPCPFACKNGQTCFNLANGDVLCDDDVDINCGEPCSSNANCTDSDYPLCITSFTYGGSSQNPNVTTTVAAVCQGEAAVCAGPV